MSDRIFITGVHTGLGLGFARRALARGATVYAVSRTMPEELRGAARFHFAELDLRSDRVEAVVDRLLDGVERIDLALLNAGVLGELAPLSEQRRESFDAVMELNVWSNKRLIERLAARTDHMIGISSGAAVNGSAGWSVYAMSKASLNLLLQVAAKEYPGTHFSAVAPGIVETPMIETVVASGELPAVQRIRETLAEKRSFTPDAAAEAIFERLAEIRAAGSGAFVDIRSLL